MKRYPQKVCSICDIDFTAHGHPPIPTQDGGNPFGDSNPYICVGSLTAEAILREQQVVVDLNVFKMGCPSSAAAKGHHRSQYPIKDGAGLSTMMKSLAPKDDMIGIGGIGGPCMSAYTKYMQCHGTEVGQLGSIITNAEGPRTVIIISSADLLIS